MVGAPASNLGASGYPDSAPVLAFRSSAVTGSGCTHSRLALSSVSLFGGAVTASSVVATGGKGAVAGLEINGSPVPAVAGQTVAVADWGQLTLGERFGRLAAPLVLRLLRGHGSLPAGTRIAVAFAAAPGFVAHGKTKHEVAARKHRHANHAGAKRRGKRRPPPDFPLSPDPFLFGGLLAPELQTNAVVSIAMQYLGVPYLWGGAGPATGFDCSGLVKYVFARLGVSLPHYAAAQFYLPDAVSVSPNELRAGDLVFFTGSDGTRKMPGHVGIYVGDGYLIDAPHTGAFVEVDSLAARWFANHYVGAKRIVGLAHSPRIAPTGASLPFADVINPFLSHPLALNAMGAIPAAAAFPAAGRDASRAGAIWGGSALAGLLLFACSGRFALRRRRAAVCADSDLRNP